MVGLRPKKLVRRDAIGTHDGWTEKVSAERGRLDRVCGNDDGGWWIAYLSGVTKAILTGCTLIESTTECKVG